MKERWIIVFIGFMVISAIVVLQATMPQPIDSKATIAACEVAKERVADQDAWTTCIKYQNITNTNYICDDGNCKLEKAQ